MSERKYPIEVTVSSITEQIKVYGKLQQLAETSEVTAHKLELGSDALIVLLDIQKALRDALSFASDTGEAAGFTKGQLKEQEWQNANL